MKKILFVEFLEHGGSATALLNFIKYLNTSRSGQFECVVVSSKNSIFEDFKNEYGFRLHVYKSPARGLEDIGAKPLKTLGNYLKLLLFLLKIIIQERPHLIHTYHYMWSIYTGPAGLITGTKVLVYLCDVWALTPKISRILMKINPKARFIAVSKYVYKRFTAVYKLSKEKVSLIYDGIEEGNFFPLNSGGIEKKFNNRRKSIIYISRITPERDIEKFIETAAIVGIAHPEVSFLHLGYHPLHTNKEYFQTLKNLVKELGIKSGRFKFLKYYKYPESVAKLIRKSFLMIIPARQFALPNIAIQAMMCGTPVIAYDVGGNSEIIHSGIDGILTTANSALAYAKQVEMLCGQKKKYLEYSKNAIKSSRKTFNAAKSYEKILSVYAVMGV